MKPYAIYSIVALLALGISNGTLLRAVEPIFVTTSTSTPSSQAQLRIYETRKAQAESIYQDLSKLRKELRSLERGTYPGANNLQPLQEQIRSMEKELLRARQRSEEAADQLPRETRQLFIEEFRSQLELELRRERTQLATLQTRYKDRHPEVINQKIKLKALDRISQAVRSTDFAAGPGLTPLDRLRTQSSLYKKEGEREQLARRYRDKHPFMIEVANQITQLEAQLAQYPAQQLTDNQQTVVLSEDRPSKLANLLKEEIQLIEGYFEETSGKPDSPTDQESSDQLRLELLELQMELAQHEGRLSDMHSLLQDQITLLRRLATQARTPEILLEYRRQIIALKRLAIAPTQ